MSNEDKILAMLDLIASEVKKTQETMVTKEEFRATAVTKEEFRATAVTKEEFRAFQETAVTKEEFRAFQEEVRTGFKTMNDKIDAQSDLFEAKLNVLNDRLFDQETQLAILKRREAL